MALLTAVVVGCSLWFVMPMASQAASTAKPSKGKAAEFIVSESQFNQMFPNRNSFYTYSGLTAALDAYPGFANTGSDTVKKQEAAAFLANVSHETGGLVHVVERDAAVAWKTGLWYWNTQSGPGTMTPHDAMVNGAGFGETIRAINGSLECNGGNPGQVQSRVDKYKQFAALLGVPPGDNLSC
ncbi:chitinase [Streptomyces sp. CA-250714]|uniref:chitinase n=1 Tax=Streptomyces sp. CA-250714 TaxID=3240060 RepID=UPI003D8FD864